jgi:predicted RNA-binding protein with PUA domain
VAASTVFLAMYVIVAVKTVETSTNGYYVNVQRLAVIKAEKREHQSSNVIVTMM